MTRRRLSQCVLLLLSGSFGAAVAEWTWRAAVRAAHARDVAAVASPLLEVVATDELYTLRAGADVVEAIADPAGGPPLEVRYRTNADRLRHHDVWPPPEDPATPQVLFAGDSYTFGTAVGDGVAFPHQVQRELRARGVGAFAINAGVPGYNARQTLARLRPLLTRHTPRHVVFAFVLNDAEPPTTVPVPLADVYGGAWSWLAEDAKVVGNALARAFVDDRVVWRPNRPPYETEYRTSWAPGSTKAAAASAAIVSMHETCRAHGAGFTVVVVPDFTREFDATYPYLGIHAQVVALGRAHGFVVRDLWPDVQGRAAAALRVPGDGHPDPEGQRLLAVAIASHLAEVLRD
jgi:lysophospholipase L1-like esterase